MSGPLFVDTSAWFALVNRGDPEHGSVRACIENPAGRLVTTNYVFDETVTLCAYRLGHAIALCVGATLLDGRVVDMIRARAADEAEAWRLFAARSDKRYSFTDCVSFTMMRRLGIRRALALDDDFRREGFDATP